MDLDSKTEAFINELSEALDNEEQKLMPETLLIDIDWDSLAVISSIALIDEHFNVSVSASQISNCKSIYDLIQLGLAS